MHTQVDNKQTWYYVEHIEQVNHDAGIYIKF